MSNREKLVAEVTELLSTLKDEIGDEYRASEEDTEPSMCITIATNDVAAESIAWVYQTGDNSYSGACYGYQRWGVGSLYRDSNPEEVATDIVDDLLYFN